MGLTFTPETNLCNNNNNNNKLLDSHISKNTSIVQL